MAHILAALALTASLFAPPSAPLIESPNCQPKTKGGNCYEPGQMCRKSDHGASGIAGDGKSIRCRDNDGWRWEPS
jgi:hypothetical protein